MRPAFDDTVADARVAILAGADTTVSALAAFFYYLLLHPAEFNLVREEIDQVYPPGADATDAFKHAELVYTSACLYVTFNHCEEQKLICQAEMNLFDFFLRFPLQDREKFQEDKGRKSSLASE